MRPGCEKSNKRTLKSIKWKYLPNERHVSQYYRLAIFVGGGGGRAEGGAQSATGSSLLTHFDCSGCQYVRST